MDSTTTIVRKEASFRMVRKLLLVFVLALVLPLRLPAQEYLNIINNAEGRYFKDVEQEIQKMYEGKDKGRGTGYKQLQRWLYFNRSRLTKDGRIQNVSLQLVSEAGNYDAALQKQSRTARITALTSGADWTSVGATSYVRTPSGYNGGLGRVNMVERDPADTNIVYAGTPAGGLWKSTNGGGTWTCLTDAIPGLVGVSGIAIDPSTPVTNRTIYILTGDGDGGSTNAIGVYKSVNNGVSWTRTGLPPVTGNGRKLVMHPTNSQILFAVLHTGIYRTTDGGTSWVNVKPGFFHDLEFKPGTPSTIYISGRGVVYTSSNGGDSWAPMNSGLPALTCRVLLAVTPANPSYLYALFGQSDGGGMFAGLYRSVNGGAFTLLSNQPNILSEDPNGTFGGEYMLALAVSPSNANEIHVGSLNCWKTTDAGANWSPTSNWHEDFVSPGDYTHADIHSLTFFGNTIYCTSDGGVFKSYYHAEDWVDISATLQIGMMYRIGSDPNQTDKVLCGLQDNGVDYITNKVMYHWYGADGMEAFASPLNSTTIFGETQSGGLIRSINNGSSVQGIHPAGAGDGDWVTPFMVDPNSGVTLYAGYTDVYKSPDEGSSWTNISSGQLGTGFCKHMDVAPSDSRYIYVSKDERLYFTENGGTLWTEITDAATTGYIKWLHVHPTNSKLIFVVAQNGVFKLTIGTTSNTWSRISNTSLPNVSYNCIVCDKAVTNNALYLGTDLGVFYKNGNLTEWIPYTNGMPRTIVNDIEIHYATRTLRVGTNGRGVWKSPLFNNTGIQTSITSPARNAEFTEGTTITINATASTTSGSITKVEFYNAGIKIGEDLTSPYSYSITNAAAGDYILNTVAYNSAGSAMVSGEVRVSVYKLRNPDNPATTVAAVNYKYYTGAWESVPDWAELTAAETGTTNNFDISSKAGLDEFGFNFTGYINVPTDGIYTFYTSSDDGSILKIGNDLVVNNDGLHGTQELSGKIGLKAGKHAITVSYFERGGDEVLAVYYSGPSISKQLIPASVLSHASSDLPPTVSITVPAGGTHFTAPANISISASATDLEGPIYKVEFYQGTTKLGEDLNYPSFDYYWTNVPAGTYTLTAKAFDQAGQSTTSAPVTIIVDGGNAAPAVSITSPASNASFSAPATITISATASDADGTVSKVEFYQGTTKLGEDLTSPYSYTWTGVAAGTYTLTAKAYDNSANVTTSSGVTVTVSSSCLLDEPSPVATFYQVKNSWNDQNAGSSVTNENSALKVTHRAYGQNELWLMETGKTITIASGQTYTVKFDFKDYAGYAISGVDVGFAQGFNSSSSPNLVQPVVAAPAGYSSSSFTTKSVSFTSSYSGSVNLTFRLRWSSQPTSQVTDYIKNISVCQSASGGRASVASAVSHLVLSPNPSQEIFTIKAEEDIALLYISDLQGRQVYSTSDIAKGATLEFGRDLTFGLYNITVMYVDGTHETVKILKTR